MIFRIYYEAAGDHVHMRFFAGKRDGALGKCGDLCMRLEEFDDFRVLTQHGQIEFRAEHRGTRASGIEREDAMRRVVTEQWVAFDGVPFPTEAECRAYERRVAHIRMVGLKIEDVEAALTRADLDLAEAIEEVARRIKRIRLGKAAAPIEAEAAADEGGGREGDEAQASEAA